MSQEIGRLGGATILVPSYDGQYSRFGGSPEAGRLLAAEREVILSAAELGARITEFPVSDPDAQRAPLAKPNTFTLHGSVLNVQDHEAAVLEWMNIKRPQTTLYAGADAATRSSVPYVLAQVNASRGAGKYMIDDDEQQRRFAKLVSDKPEEEWARRFEIREYIPTPSDHYTSYRVVTSAVGEILAAGLVYSSHTESSNQRIELDPWTAPEMSSDYAAHLENPGSPYYLASRDIRSNVSQGGGVIPLMGGENARSITARERDILEAHGIDALAPSLPATLDLQTRSLGSTLGRVSGLVAAFDFLQHRDTRYGFYYQETNTHPGPETFAACWKRGRIIGPAEGYKKLLIRSLASIAASLK